MTTPRRCARWPSTRAGPTCACVVAVTRDGSARCLLRQRDHDSDDRVALGDDIAPGLVHALRATFSPD